ncbi:NAD-dependent epimerase/dehydratase family protein [Roseivirga misakiensis]|uniref:NAD-dependent epimerase n=1 Tax=Roseivirga misakiensis TaxID=1563681 RepID=A0A1E5T254_9BACT|nr:NAD-dependent epimerase/dehydratase family protein [Roseivirga misakiensis]OEK05463.1 NAD-dependent epimerase [Roseivirga misakiensis]
MDRILVIGACGQLGSELTNELGKIFGNDNVIASDISAPNAAIENFHFEQLDVMDADRLATIVDSHGITQIYHLAAILSAKGEENPQWAWNLNMTGLLNVLELAKEKNLKKIYWPSSIAVFGPSTPMDNTPQHTVMDPNTVYGISKLAGERWCEYYFDKYGVDVRSLRYPGLIGYKSLPGGGTTDYAVDIYHKALSGEPFECFLSEDTYLPMMYMQDAIKATIDLMQAPAEQVKIRSSYNISAIDFSPKEIVASIKEHIPNFTATYKPDFRQAIADSWPNSISDAQAREDWGWDHAFDLTKMTSDILENLPELLGDFQKA